MTDFSWRQWSSKHPYSISYRFKIIEKISFIQFQSSIKIINTFLNIIYFSLLLFYWISDITFRSLNSYRRCQSAYSYTACINGRFSWGFYTAPCDFISMALYTFCPILLVFFSCTSYFLLDQCKRDASIMFKCYIHRGRHSVPTSATIQMFLTCFLYIF